MGPSTWSGSIGGVCSRTRGRPKSRTAQQTLCGVMPRSTSQNHSALVGGGIALARGRVRSSERGEIDEHRDIVRSGSYLRVETLAMQVPVDEPDRHDPVSLGCVQQSFAGVIPGHVVLEGGSVETREGVLNVRLVVNWQPAPPTLVDISECAIRQAGPLAGSEFGLLRQEPGRRGPPEEEGCRS
jgi:hypothetical protein